MLECLIGYIYNLVLFFIQPIHIAQRKSLEHSSYPVVSYFIHSLLKRRFTWPALDYQNSWWYNNGLLISTWYKFHFTSQFTDSTTWPHYKRSFVFNTLLNHEISKNGVTCNCFNSICLLWILSDIFAWKDYLWLKFSSYLLINI